MTRGPPLTHFIGQAERSLRALLDPLISDAGLSFSQWTVLVFLHGKPPLTRPELIDRQLVGRIASFDAAAAAVDDLLARNLVEVAAPTTSGNPQLVLTQLGTQIFQSLFSRVSSLAGALTQGIPEVDVEATRRTLGQIVRNADAELARTS